MLRKSLEERRAYFLQELTRLTRETGLEVFGGYDAEILFGEIGHPELPHWTNFQLATGEWGALKTPDDAFGFQVDKASAYAYAKKQFSKEMFESNLWVLIIFKTSVTENYPSHAVLEMAAIKGFKISLKPEDYEPAREVLQKIIALLDLESRVQSCYQSGVEYALRQFYILPEKFPGCSTKGE